jgi:hypothetical protein
MRARPLAFGLAALVAGCCGMCAETTSSENIRTHGLSETTIVEATDDQPTRVTVTLRAGGPLSNLFPSVAGGDRLEAGNGTETVPLAFSRGGLDAPHYYGFLPGDSAGRTIGVLLSRTGDVSATETRVTVPLAFTIASPAAGEHLSSARHVVVTWSPTAASTMDWGVSGDCVHTDLGHQHPDVGRIDLPLRAASAAEGGRPGTCEVRLALERVEAGVVDPAFGEGGTIGAIQRRVRKFWYTP